MQLKLGMKLYPKSHEAVSDSCELVAVDLEWDGSRKFKLEYLSSWLSDSGVGHIWLSEKTIKKFYTDDGQTAIEIKEA